MKILAYSSNYPKIGIWRAESDFKEDTKYINIRLMNAHSELLSLTDDFKNKEIITLLNYK